MRLFGLSVECTHPKESFTIVLKGNVEKPPLLQRRGLGSVCKLQKPAGEDVNMQKSVIFNYGLTPVHIGPDNTIIKLLLKCARR